MKLKANLIPPELTPEQISFTYAGEADLLIEQGKEQSERLIALREDQYFLRMDPVTIQSKNEGL